MVAFPILGVFLQDPSHALPEFLVKIINTGW